MIKTGVSEIALKEYKLTPITLVVNEKEEYKLNEESEIEDKKALDLESFDIFDFSAARSSGDETQSPLYFLMTTSETSRKSLRFSLKSLWIINSFILAINYSAICS